VKRLCITCAKTVKKIACLCTQYHGSIRVDIPDELSWCCHQVPGFQSFSALAALCTDGKQALPDSSKQNSKIVRLTSTDFYENCMFAQHSKPYFDTEGASNCEADFTLAARGWEGEYGDCN
jgi:hypothetical protein